MLKRLIFFYLFLFVFFQNIKIQAWLLEPEIYPYQDLAGQLVDTLTDLRYGFSISEGIATLRTKLPVSNMITFGKKNAVLNVMSDLNLDSNVTFSFWTDGVDGNKGYISGNGNTIFLNGNILIPDNCSLTFLNNTKFDGQGKLLVLGDNANLIVDSNATLSLQNMKIFTGDNNLNDSPIKVFDNGILSVQNISLTLGSDFLFDNGFLFIHDDVAIRGISEFIYSSTQGCYIDSYSRLKFDLETVFTYSPYSDDNNLIKMKDKTSRLYLKGCTLQTTHTGLKLTKGRLVFDKSVTVSLLPINVSVDYSTTSSTKIDLQENKQIVPVSPLYWIRDVEFNRDGKYFVAGGISSGNNGSGMIFEINSDGSVGEKVDTTSFSGEVDAMSFSPDSNYLAVGGTAWSGKYAERYSFDNFNGKLGPNPQTIPAPNRIRGMDFSPDGKYLAIGCSGLTSAQIACFIYPMNKDYLITSTIQVSYYQEVREVKFSPDSRFLAVAGAWDDGSGNYGQVYPIRSNGTIGNAIPIPYTSGGQMRAISFSPDGRYIAVGGIAASSAVRVYPFNSDGTLGTVMIVPHSGCSSLSFSPDGSFLYVDKFIFPVDLDNGYIGSPKQYSFIGNTIEDIDFSPDERLLAIGGGTWNVDAAAIYDFFPDYGYNVDIYYSFGNVGDTSNPGFETAFVFGDESKGASHNLYVDILPGAKVDLTGKIDIQNVS